MTQNKSWLRKLLLAFLCVSWIACSQITRFDKLHTRQEREEAEGLNAIRVYEYEYKCINHNPTTIFCLSFSQYPILYVSRR